MKKLAINLILLFGFSSFAFWQWRLNDELKIEIRRLTAKLRDVKEHTSNNSASSKAERPNLAALDENRAKQAELTRVRAELSALAQEERARQEASEPAVVQQLVPL